ncbi:integrase_H2C2 domain-containing protein [Trichonephila inaurata madagascariensis]|uniref:Integrase_H2C2 domain-containing protein n=1 Tax=Trichonephila inaurata madagascariensis TaxID=2747483 RepID=A0A8X7C4U2_9ARAC|nr:integrase_H2C2 domain-containing protein [Trichonephila inaurata madagascariensis]
MVGRSQLVASFASREWPISDVEVDVNEVEVNKERTIVTSMMNVQTTDIKSDYFSTYSRNNRIVTWILRFIHNVSNATKLKGSLGYEEFKRAEVLVFKSLQSNAFEDERLLAKMQAFKDEDGLLRIRTKLAGSYEMEDFKFPILLPASDVVVKLIREEHVKAMHAGSSILLARLREKFGIIRAKRLVKQVLSEPLTYIHEDPNELLPLSPAMFVHGNSNCETPDLDQVDRSSLVKCTKCRSCVKI